MAATSRGTALTEQQRVAQQRVNSAFLVEFLAAWALLDSTRLDDTGPAWVSAVLRLIPEYRTRSAEVAAEYFAEFRAAEAPTSTTRPRIERHAEPPEPAARRESPARERRSTSERAPRRARLDIDRSAFEPRPERRARIELPAIDWAPSERAARVSLQVTGPIGQKAKAARGKPLQVARDESFVEAAGAASRAVLTGGRQSLLTLLQDDPQALGWARVTDGDPCAFCALLASRGPVYGSEAAASFRAHGNCACTAEPVYSRDAPWPGRSAEFRRLYREVTRGHSGQNAINAFRRAYEQQQREQRRSGAA